MDAGESEYPAVLKTRNLLIFRDAKNAGTAKLCLTGTYLEREIFHLPIEMQVTASRFVSELSTRISSFASNDPV